MEQLLLFEDDTALADHFILEEAMRTRNLESAKIPGVLPSVDHLVAGEELSGLGLASPSGVA